MQESHFLTQIPCSAPKKVKMPVQEVPVHRAEGFGAGHIISTLVLPKTKMTEESCGAFNFNLPVFSFGLHTAQ
jgi:hypothetical protein